jgi:hypothetical protein
MLAKVFLEIFEILFLIELKTIKKNLEFFYDISSIKYSRKSNIWFEDKSISLTII